MMDTSEDNLKTKSLRSALARGGKDMKVVFDRRSKQLKVCLFPRSCRKSCFRSAAAVLAESTPFPHLTRTFFWICRSARIHNLPLSSFPLLT